VKRFLFGVVLNQKADYGARRTRSIPQQAAKLSVQLGPTQRSITRGSIHSSLRSSQAIKSLTISSAGARARLFGRPARQGSLETERKGLASVYCGVFGARAAGMV
jgi:hypothetical protein